MFRHALSLHLIKAGCDARFAQRFGELEAYLEGLESSGRAPAEDLDTLRYQSKDNLEAYSPG